MELRVTLGEDHLAALGVEARRALRRRAGVDETGRDDRVELAEGELQLVGRLVLGEVLQVVRVRVRVRVRVS